MTRYVVEVDGGKIAGFKHQFAAHLEGQLETLYKALAKDEEILLAQQRYDSNLKRLKEARAELKHLTSVEDYPIPTLGAKWYGRPEMSAREFCTKYPTETDSE